METRQTVLASDAESAAERAADRRRLEEAERWVNTLGQAIHQAVQLPRSAVAEVTAPVATSGPWRASDDPLTPPSAGAESLEGDDARRAGSFSRLEVRVDLADLGPVSVVVDRTGGGLAVVLGVETAESRTAIEPELGALGRALCANGISLIGVQVVHAHELGTVLARSDRRQRAGEELARSNPREKPRSAKRLNLIG